MADSQYDWVVSVVLWNVVVVRLELHSGGLRYWWVGLGESTDDAVDIVFEVVGHRSHLGYQFERPSGA